MEKQKKLLRNIKDESNMTKFTIKLKFIKFVEDLQLLLWATSVIKLFKIEIINQ